VAAIVLIVVGCTSDDEVSAPPATTPSADVTTAPPPTDATIAPTTAVAVTAADIEGTVWASTGDPPPAPHGAWAESPITWFVLRPDGSIRGADRCRTFDGGPGSWRVTDSTLHVTPPASSGATCGDGAAVSLFDDGPIAAGLTVDGHLALTTRHTAVLAEPLDEASQVHADEMVGRWTDGLNTFEFGADGVLRFSYQETCDGSDSVSAGRLDIDFGACDSSSVVLSSPIFRKALPHVSRTTGRLLLDGDAGIFALTPMT